MAEVIERIRAGGKGRTADTDSELSAIDNVTLLLKNVPVHGHMGKLSCRWIAAQFSLFLGRHPVLQPWTNQHPLVLKF